jgi:hypothetical protein
MENLKEFCARWSDGTVNIDATVEKFRENLIAWSEKRDAAMTNIAIAVSNIFDKYKGKTLTMPTLKTLVIGENGTEPDDIQEAFDLTEEYVKSRPTRFLIAKGRGGGVSRVEVFGDE